MSVPASIERKVPREIADDLDVVGRVRIELDTCGSCDRGKDIGRDVQVRLLEFEGFDFSANETNCGVLGALINCVLPVADILPTEASEDVDARSVSVFYITSDSSAESRLQVDLLYRTLQERRGASVEPVIPAQKPHGA